MIDVVAVAGLGFKTPTSESLRTYMLLESVDDLNLVLALYLLSFVHHGQKHGAPSRVMDGQIGGIEL